MCFSMKAAMELISSTGSATFALGKGVEFTGSIIVRIGITGSGIQFSSVTATSIV